ncbi:hypothetical protein CQA53_05645 [Helicobacter didelphidarum]|uniref:Uncharacterized protein n=1 Tax=Helicobacter didelphidarum TaxID=2040648 RepID=A0A3D8IKT9_9HELI|nr:hypothetical protein [Helicobacter didelphidarum]RDU65819.1 hypothetical protein CQA53_05645 [Helicobacter didelphidarum]
MQRISLKKVFIKQVGYLLICFVCISLSLALFIGCTNAKMKPPKKSPCACYDILMDMEQYNV